MKIRYMKDEFKGYLKSEEISIYFFMFISIYVKF